MIELSICILMVVIGLLGGIAGLALAIIYDPKTVEKINRLAGKSNLQ